jgi:epoxyqueuosine reductase QueG
MITAVADRISGQFAVGNVIAEQVAADAMEICMPGMGEETLRVCFQNRARSCDESILGCPKARGKKNLRDSAIMQDFFEARGDRVGIAGRAMTYPEGEIEI